MVSGVRDSLQSARLPPECVIVSVGDGVVGKIGRVTTNRRGSTTPRRSASLWAGRGMDSDGLGLGFGGNGHSHLPRTQNHQFQTLNRSRDLIEVAREHSRQSLEISISGLGIVILNPKS
jgi:hypothetical protein